MPPCLTKSRDEDLLHLVSAVQLMSATRARNCGIAVGPRGVKAIVKKGQLVLDLTLFGA